MSHRSFGMRYYLRELWNSKMGKAGIILVIILFGISLTSFAVPSNVYSEWLSGTGFLTNPHSAPPIWYSFFNPSVYFGSQEIYGNLEFIQSIPTSNQTIYIYTDKFTFNWDKDVPPSDVYFILIFNSTVSTISITWIKPSGDNLTINVPPNLINTQFDLVSAQTPIVNYIREETGTSPAYILTKTLSSALFNKGGPNLLQNPIDKGNYRVEVIIISNKPISTLQNKILLVGTAYGLMGTDFFGRPIDLGILLGLGPALLIGSLTSVVSVTVGVLVGGISGYLGGRKDDVIQWVILVFLALPALPFLITIAFVYKPDLVLESLLIAFLSWPFYAIIARSTALSIRSQTFVEADKVLGIPARRIFLTHFIPRLIPFATAYMALGIPAAIILSQTLAFLGIEPVGIITWGKILSDAEAYQAAVNGWWWWIVFPGASIVIVSLPFVLIGLALEKIIYGGR